jgi:hypothetical protein
LAEEQFRLPGSSYEELAKIIVGYSRFDSEIPPSEVGRVIGMHETIVSRNNAFLMAVGVVTGGKRKAITPLGMGLARALEHQMPDEITNHWQSVISQVPFFRNLLSAVRIRRGMDLSTLQAHVAYSAGQKKSPAVMTGASAVVEIMRAAAVLREEGGKIVAAEETFSTPSVAEPGIPSSPTPGSSVQAVSSPSFMIRSAGTPLSVQLQIQVQCTPADIDALGDKLRALIDKIAGGPQQSEE